MKLNRKENMNPHFVHSSVYGRRSVFAGVLALALMAGLPLQAQQGQGGGRRSSTSGSAQYPRTGAIGDAYYSIDPETRRVVVISDEDTSLAVSQVLSNLDRPKPQVLIKVVFLEVTHNNSLDFGVEGSFTKNFGDPYTSGLMTNFSVVNNAIVPSSIVPATKNPTMGASTAYGGAPASTGLYTILGQDYTVTLHAIAQAGNARVLSRPSILARNNQPATITVGQSVPLITSVSYNGLNGTPVNAYRYQDVGVILKVTPFITQDQMVEMIVSPQISSVDPTQFVTVSPGVTAPYIDVRSADTVAVTPDGQTIIIGGLMQASKARTDTKVPILGDIPILGNLFKRRQSSDSTSELLIFLTPHIVEAPTELAALSKTEREKSDAVREFKQQELDKFLDSLPTGEAPSKDKKAKSR